MPQIAGGCLCGKVRYSANGRPAFVGVCHCTDCQKFTGSAFAIVVGVPKPALTVQGKLTTLQQDRRHRQVDRAAVLPGVRFLHCR